MDLELLLGLINEVENNKNRRPNRQGKVLGQLNSSQQHAARILDGLAGILVSKAGEVVAVGVQESERKIIVTISTNEDCFPLHIYDHLTTVWALLKGISDGYNQDRVQSKRPSHITTSTHKLPEETQQKIYNFLLAIYRYSSEGLLHTINKRFRENETRLEAFKRIVSSLDAQQKLTASLDEIWFPLATYLEKIPSMQKGVNWLLAFAYDPTLRPRFFTGQGIEIRCVSPGRENIRLPRPKRWKEVARAALESQGETLRASDPKPGSSRHLKKNQSINAAVHCEVALALHFLSKDLEGPSPLPYIGISKPSCYACWGIFRCLQRSGAGLFIRRTNSNAPFPWKYPSTELDSSTYNAAKIYQEFYSIIAERSKGALGSNSHPEKVAFVLAAVEQLTKEI
ncbi:nucleic acid/nucleotide deaminase domain-containing protein [Aspergillus glaucus CBS 516.65]|uniref:Uncharacterized protein n=1 Tax=Aspergillus glaucus CBS 516.65 TaxID=1160497 RepID=A0A1L9VKU3_ASPGL|nr:hypothetical protein ASPGLDRAFT_25212 [Aspergillus glaucus CBS 516.65]OJJ84511.1 hypothetical protein ASPGLDRAFT_25212 [Aspergillus glaucus CBS 516.65]